MKARFMRELPPMKFPRVLVDGQRLLVFYIRPITTDRVTRFDIRLKTMRKDYTELSDVLVMGKEGTSYLARLVRRGDKRDIEMLVQELNYGGEAYSADYVLAVVDSETLAIKSKTPLPHLKNTLPHAFPTAERTLTSVLSKDDDDPGNYWGKYPFKFRLGGGTVEPAFDAVVDYEKDKGQLLHGVRPAGQGVEALISVRTSSGGQSRYDIYTANTEDYSRFTNTRPVVFEGYPESDWFCYPCLFENGGPKLICNQNDFGKSSASLLFDVV